MRFFMLFCVLLTYASRAQVTIRITELPSGNTPQTALFIAGSFNNWNAGDTDYRFTRVDRFYEVTLPPQQGTVKYKITRGSWRTCEGSTSGGQIANREFIYKKGLVLGITVKGWEVSSPTYSTATANVKILSNDFWIPQLRKTRRIWIYLPSGYERDLSRTYPVMYMHDGQNIFDVSTSFSGEWGVDETLRGMEQQGDEGCIVVAIDNGGADRINEYSPYVNPEYGGGQGDAYADFIANTLKHYIDSAYRTKTGREYTAIAGSSMGGLISLYTAVKYPGIFSKAGIFSPALWFSDSLFTYVASRPEEGHIKCYFVAGRNESPGMISEMSRMVKLLKSKGYRDPEIKELVKEDGEHKEWFWQREFGPCYDWLFSERKK
jgi:predicted alpha/beta superfamily hydrolase